MILIKLLLLLPFIACWHGPDETISWPPRKHKHHKPFSCALLNRYAEDIPKPPDIDGKCGILPDFDDDLAMRAWYQCSSWYWSNHAGDLQWWIDVTVAGCAQ